MKQHEAVIYLRLLSCGPLADRSFLLCMASNYNGTTARDVPFSELRSFRSFDVSPQGCFAPWTLCPLKLRTTAITGRRRKRRPGGETYGYSSRTQLITTSKTGASVFFRRDTTFPSNNEDCRYRQSRLFIKLVVTKYCRHTAVANRKKNSGEGV